MPNPEISVVIPAYNSGRTVTRSLDSVLSQTLTPLEVIVVDDGSVDDTFAIVSDYIAYYGLSSWRLLRQRNGGPACARDAAIRVARGSHVALLDADDVWLPYKLETTMAIVLMHRLDIIGARVHYRSGNDRCRLLDARRMLFSNPYFTSTVMFSRVAYSDIGGFDLNQRYSEDYKLWLAFAWRGMRCGQMSQSMAIYRADATGLHNGLSSHLWRMQKNEIGNYRWLRATLLAPAIWCFLAQVFSWLKFAYRVTRSCLARASKVMRPLPVGTKSK